MGEEFAATREEIFTMLSKEPLEKVLGVGEYQPSLHSLQMA
jgi:hypothetical protein